MARPAVVGVLGLVAAVIVCAEVWRAADQAITHDEAITYLYFVARPWSQLTHDYLPNNHLLHTAAAKLATDLFGASPFTLRLPALASGVGFLALLVWIACGPWGGGIAGVLGFAALALHPIFLDFFACARGYGPASAALLGCIVVAQRLLTGKSRRTRGSLVALGIGLAAVTAINPAFAFAAAALLIAFATMVWRQGAPGFGLREATWFTGVPASCGAGAMAWWMLSSARPAFTLGAESWAATFAPWPGLWLRHLDVGDLPRATAALDVLIRDHGGALLALLLSIAGVGAGWWLCLVFRPRPARPASPAMVSFVLCGGAVLLTVLGATLAHRCFDLPLPAKRTSLPIVLYAAIMIPSALAAVRGHGIAARAAAVALGGLLCVVIALEVSVFPGREFAEFRPDAGSHRVHLELQRLASPGRRLRVVSLPFYFEPMQNYYRSILGSEWLEEVEREIRPGVQYDFALVPRGLVDHPLFAPLLGPVVWVEPASDCAIVEMKRP